MICLWKKAGFSSQEIALHQRRTVVAIDTIFSRAKQKIRKALGVDDVTDAQPVVRVDKMMAKRRARRSERRLR